MKQLLTTLIIVAFALLFSSSVAFAQPSQDVQEDAEAVEESTNELITAKDEESPFTLSQRIKAFKDVVDLSLSEAKDIKVKLLSVDLNDKELEEWRETTIESLNAVIAHYESVKADTNENEDEITQEEIIAQAKEFKQWRNNNYIPLHDQVQNFLLMEKEKQIISIANQRWSKIQKDIEVLRKAGISGISKLEEMLSTSKQFIEKGSDQNKEAMSLFRKLITPEKNTATTTGSTATTTGTSTQPTASATVSALSIQADGTTTPVATETSTTSQATGTQTDTGTTTIQLEQSTSTASSSSTTIPDSLDSSIRGLVSSSLQNVRESYQVFIEMSSFVRELLE